MNLAATDSFDHRLVARLHALGRDVLTVMNAEMRGLNVVRSYLRLAGRA